MFLNTEERRGYVVSLLRFSSRQDHFLSSIAQDDNFYSIWRLSRFLATVYFPVNLLNINEIIRCKI